MGYRRSKRIDSSPAEKEGRGQALFSDLGKLKQHKSMGPDGVHPQVLEELAGAGKLPSTVSERSWRKGEVAEVWKKADVILVFKKAQQGRPRQLQASQPDLHPR